MPVPYQASGHLEEDRLKCLVFWGLQHVAMHVSEGRILRENEATSAVDIGGHQLALEYRGT